MALPSGVFAWSSCPYVGRAGRNRQPYGKYPRRSWTPPSSGSPGRTTRPPSRRCAARGQKNSRAGAGRGLRGPVSRLVPARGAAPGQLAGDGRRRAGRHDELVRLRADAAAGPRRGQLGLPGETRSCSPRTATAASARCCCARCSATPTSSASSASCCAPRSARSRSTGGRVHRGQRPLVRHRPAASHDPSITTEISVKTEITSTICGGKFRANPNFRDHVRTDEAGMARLAGVARVTDEVALRARLHYTSPL